MKKITVLLFSLFLLLSPIQQVHAAAFSLTMTGPTQIVSGQQFTVMVGVANVTNMMNLTATFAYDSSKLSFVSNEKVSPAESVAFLGSKLIADFDIVNGKTGTFNFAKLTFRATSAFVAGQSATISFRSIQYANKTTDFDAADKSISIKMVSDNSYLKTLTVSSGSLNFSKATTNYTVVVENNVSSLAIGATVDNDKSTVSGAGSKSLAVYSNSFNLIVTAENGSKRTYTITVLRKDTNGLASPPSSNTNLKEIKISGFDEFNSAFTKGTLAYTLDVGNLITDLDLTATAEDAKSKVEITKAPLIVGVNTITIKVTAESGDIKTYTITVNRSSDVPTVDESEIIAALGTVTTPTIGLNSPVSGEISAEILSALKASGKTLIVVMKEAGVTLYEWLIDGTMVTDTTPLIKTKISFISEDKAAIDTMTNYAQGILLTFEENLSLPQNTRIRITVSKFYQDGDKITLYYYNPTTKKLSVQTKDLIVENGKVEFALVHTSTYFLSQTQLKTPSQFDYVFVLVSIVEALIIVLLFFKKKSPRKTKRDLPVN